MAKVNRILIVAITRLGDMLQASPTIMGLKREHPEAKLTVLIESNFAAVCDGIPGIDEVYPLNLSMVCQCLAREGAGIVDAYKYLDGVIEELKGRNFDFCLNMSSSGYTALLLKMLNVKDMRGWVSDDEGHRLIMDPWSMLFSAFVYHSNRDYNSINLVDIFRCAAGVTQHPKSLMYRVPEAADQFGETFLIENGLTGEGPVVTIQAGASQGKRQWSPPKFAQIAKLLVERLNARVIFTGSASEEKIVNAIFQSYSHPQMVSAVGKTDLGQLASLLRRSNVLITGDTGTMHLSVAVGTPVVALFLASALCFETGPYSEGNIVLQPQISCNPCNPNLPCSRPDCHNQISPELLFSLVEKRLALSTPDLLKLRLSPKETDPREVAVFVTTFDEDNFLLFQQINGRSARNGLPGDYFDSARSAYRSLWKGEFARIGNGTAAPAGERELPVYSQPVISALRGVVALTEHGKELLGKLESLIRDVSSPPRLLGETTVALAEVERQVESIGLSNGMLGAIIRMFIMEKENMRGDDPLVLAQETKGLYDTLSRRCRLFESLFEHHTFNNLSADLS